MYYFRSVGVGPTLAFCVPAPGGTGSGTGPFFAVGRRRRETYAMQRWDAAPPVTGRGRSVGRSWRACRRGSRRGRASLPPSLPTEPSPILNNLNSRTDERRRAHVTSDRRGAQDARAAQAPRKSSLEWRGRPRPRARASQAGCTSHYCKFLLQLQSFLFFERGNSKEDINEAT